MMPRNRYHSRIIRSQDSARRSLLSGRASGILNPRVGEKVRGNTFRSPDRTSTLGPPRSRPVQELPAAVLPFTPSSRHNGPKCAYGERTINFGGLSKWRKKDQRSTPGICITPTWQLWRNRLAIMKMRRSNGVELPGHL